MQTTRFIAGAVATVLLCAEDAAAGDARGMSNASSPPVSIPKAAAMNGAKSKHLTPDSTIGELLRHPAFSGFGSLLLPWDGRDYDDTMRLRQAGSLLPYHSHVDPAAVTAGLNRMIDDAAAGRRVHYDIYTAQQKGVDPSLESTGLFFFRGKPGAPFAIVAPGGGFQYVGSLHEGFPYAVEIARRGYNAFVLKYRVGSGGRLATQDLAAALSYIVRNAEALGVSRTGYSLWGSSAGARMAAAIGSHGAASFGGDELPRPATVVMAYTGHSDVANVEPPTFVVSGGRDAIAPASVMAQRVAALKKTGAPVEYRHFQALEHGFGPGSGTSAAGWLDEAIDFWDKNLK